MSRRPFTVHLPTSADVGSIFGTTATMLRAVGWDLGRKYDEFMRPKAGPDWLEQLRLERMRGYNPAPMYRRQLNLRDPAFCLREPAMNSDSPLRDALPRNSAFYDLMETVANIRNTEFHFDAMPTLDRLRHHAEQVTRLARLADLPLKDEMGAIVERIAQLKAGKVPPPPGVAELIAQVRKSQEDLQAASEQIAEARREAKANASARGRLGELESEFEALQDELLLAQRAVQSAERRARDAARDVEVDRLQPGDRWPGPPEGRPLRLLPRVADLYDPELVDLLSNQVGPSAVEASRRWTEFLPHGGPVILTESGAGVALIGVTWTFLGTIDGSPDDEQTKSP